MQRSFVDCGIFFSIVSKVSARYSEGPPFSAISSSDNLRLGIRLGQGLWLKSVVWLWQYQELFPATTMNNGFQSFRMADPSEWRPFGMADPNRFEKPRFTDIAITVCYRVVRTVYGVFPSLYRNCYYVFACQSLMPVCRARPDMEMALTCACAVDPDLRFPTLNAA